MTGRSSPNTAWPFGGAAVQIAGARKVVFGLPGNATSTGTGSSISSSRQGPTLPVVCLHFTCRNRPEQRHTARIELTLAGQSGSAAGLQTSTVSPAGTTATNLWQVGSSTVCTLRTASAVTWSRWRRHIIEISLSSTNAHALGYYAGKPAELKFASDLTLTSTPIPSSWSRSP
jgi:hypothetical protein